MTPQEVLKNLETLQKENDLVKIEAYITNPVLNHPLFYHVVVEKFIIADNKEKAMYYASQASEFVFVLPGSPFICPAGVSFS